MMKKKWLPVMIGALMSAPAFADVEIVTDRAVVGQQDELVARLHFPTQDRGDLYVAARINGQLRFYGEDGRFHPEPVPYRQDGLFDQGQEETILRFPGAVVPPGRYTLYSVVTDTDADVFDTSRWHGPVAKQLFIANEPPQQSGDMDGDGWPDDDSDHDGFSDADHNFDGWRDDDADHNGIPDTEEGNGSTDNSGSADNSGGTDQSGGDDNGAGGSSHGGGDDNGASGSDHSGGDDNGSSGSDHSGEDDNGTGDSDHSGGDDNGAGSSDHDHSGHDHGGDDGAGNTGGNTGGNDAAPGASLYAQNCADCHGADPANGVNNIQNGADPARIRWAIANNRGGMGFLSGQLSDTDVQAIAAYIASR